MRTIGVVTVGRSDFGIYLPVLERLSRTPGMRVRLFVGGMHLSPEYGLTVNEVEQSGFDIAERIEMLVSSQTQLGVATSVGIGVSGFARAFERNRPDILLVLGDRFEMFTAVSAAAFLNIPLAHIHGGEATDGLVDNVLRHAITKMAHLHFVSHPIYAQRVIQMGEDPWRVTVSGAPALDLISSTRFMSPRDLHTFLKVTWTRRPLLVTFHPTTLEPGQAEDQTKRLVQVLENTSDPIVWTCPNADAEGARIIKLVDKFGAAHPARVRVIKNLGSRVYFSLMKHSSVMVGNSSSGIIEAASFALPVVNVGRRQQGRLHGANVINVEGTTEGIGVGLRRALSPVFQRSICGIKNVYGDGRAAIRITRVLKRAALGPTLLWKHFFITEGR